MYGQPPIEIVPTMVSSLGPWAPLAYSATGVSAPASATYEAANRAVFLPIAIPVTCVARRVWWANGATVSGGADVSVAIYTSAITGVPDVKLVECAATTQGTANEVQFVDITDTTLTPGPYWLALASSSATNTTFFRMTGSTLSDVVQRFQQASITVGSLPSTATPVESSGANIYLCGFATTASP